MTYVVIDFETTGLDYRTEQITEIGAVRLDENFNEVGSYHTFINLYPGNELSKFTDITQEMVDAGVPEVTGMKELKSFLGSSIVVAQFAPFDFAFLSKYEIYPHRYICTKSLTSQAEPEESSSLGPTCERLGIELVNAHRALDDAKATARLLEYRVKQGGLKLENTLVVTEGRPFNFIPKYTREIYTKKGELVIDYK